MPSNRVSLYALQDMSLDDIAELPIEQLALLFEDLSETKAIARRCEAALKGALRKRVAPAEAELRKGGNDTGTVRIPDMDGHVVAVTVPKRIKWSQDGLSRAWAALMDMGEDPAEYIGAELSVSERAYGAWPSSLKKLFEGARTVETGAAILEILPPLPPA